MSIKEIIVSVDFSQTGRERMRFALDVARTHEAYVTAFYTSPTTTPVPEGSPSEIAEAMEAEFERELNVRKLQGGWMLSSTPVVDDIVAQIKCTDLAILGLGSPDSGDPDPQGFRIAEVVRFCGRPILGVPVSRLATSSFSKVMIAWDGSREATRALHDSIPLLRRAEEIWIASIGSTDLSWPRRAVAHLAKHGLNATVDTLPPYDPDIGSELLQRAAMREVDLVVAGAYGHSRLGEDIFGGASNTLLHQMLVPILLSH